MTLEYFIQKLGELKPAENLLINEGFSGIHLDVFKKGYALEKKEPRHTIIDGNLIERLMAEYETQYIRFNDYSFTEEIEVIDGLSVFCTSSHSIIGFKNATGEIIEYDIEEMSEMNFCSKDIDSFLDALLPLLELQSLQLQGLADSNDNETNEKYLSICVSKAGGSKYMNFFKHVVL
jgi:hypothetical protein